MCVAFFVWVVPVFADGTIASAPEDLKPAVSGPKTVVLLLTEPRKFEDLREGGPLRDVRDLAQIGGIALMNTAVSGKITEAATYLSVGAGEHLQASDVPDKSLREARISRSIADFATEVSPTHPQDGGLAANPVYRRRFGRWPPEKSSKPLDKFELLHLGVPALQEAQATSTFAAQVGSLGRVLRENNRRIAAYGDWQAGMVATDENGCIPQGSFLGSFTPEWLNLALRSTNVLIAAVHDDKSTRLLTRSLLEDVKAKNISLIIVCCYPPRDGEGRFERLGFIVAGGPTIPENSLLTSSTTRTPGLVASIDLAPLILETQKIPSRGYFTGHAPSGQTHPDRWEFLFRLDEQVNLLHVATNSTLAAYILIALFSLLAGSILLSLGKEHTFWSGIVRGGFIVAATIPLMLLLLGQFLFASSLLFQMAFGLGTLIIAALCYLLLTGFPLFSPPMRTLCGLLALVVTVDVFSGALLVSRSVLSAGQLAGLRFYGIGNEYMGLTIGCALTVAMTRKNRYVLLLWLFLALGIGMPEFGANAGGAITAVVGFTLGAYGILRQQPPKWWMAIVAAAAGIGFALGLAQLDRMRPESTQSHFAQALAVSESRGFSALAEIAVRKIGMNLSLTQDARTMGALIIVLGLALLLTTGTAGERVKEAFRTHSYLRHLFPAVLFAALAAFLFNDSGIIAALTLLAPPTALLLDTCLNPQEIY